MADTDEKVDAAEKDPADSPEKLRLVLLMDASEKFREERLAAAQLSYELSALELQRTEMRATIVAELISGGLSKTAALDQARTTEEYVNITADIASKTRDWEVAYIEAEYARMVHAHHAMAHMDAYKANNEATELRRIQTQLDERIRQLEPLGR
jgi:hypothetical protein